MTSPSFPMQGRPLWVAPLPADATRKPSDHKGRPYAEGRDDDASRLHLNPADP